MTTIDFVSAAGAGSASRIAVQAFNSTEVITALKNGSGNLELIGWEIGDNTITRRASAEAGSIDEVALALLGRRAVTAFRDGSGRLRLMAWEVPPGLGSLTAIPGSDTLQHAGNADLITLTVLRNSVVVTAIRTAGGNLKLITWKLLDDGRILRISDSDNPITGADQAGAVSRIATAAFANPFATIVVTAVRAGNGHLKLITWNVSLDGTQIKRLGTPQDTAGEAGDVSDIAIVRGPENDDLSFEVVTPVQAGNDRLKIIAWKISDDGTIIQRNGDSDDQITDEASKIAVARTGLKPTYLTSLRTGPGELLLIASEFEHPNVIPTGRHELGSGEVTETALVNLGDSRVLSAIRLRDFLSLDVWRITEGPFGPTSPLTGATATHEATNKVITE